MHFLIAAIYLGYTAYRFVISNPPNPIGVGLSQWVLIIAHFITTIVMIGILKKSGSKKEVLKNRLTHAAIIVFIIVAYLIFSAPIWAWLWTLRH